MSQTIVSATNETGRLLLWATSALSNHIVSSKHVRDRQPITRAAGDSLVGQCGLCAGFQGLPAKASLAPLSLGMVYYTTGDNIVVTSTSEIDRRATDYNVS